MQFSMHCLQVMGPFAFAVFASPKQASAIPANPKPNFFSACRRVTDWANPLASSSNLLFIGFHRCCFLVEPRHERCAKEGLDAKSSQKTNYFQNGFLGIMQCPNQQIWFLLQSLLEEQGFGRHTPMQTSFWLQSLFVEQGLRFPPERTPIAFALSASPKQASAIPASPTPNRFSACRRVADWANPLASSSNFSFILFLLVLPQPPRPAVAR
jgi:hypothetical protein